MSEVIVSAFELFLHLQKNGITPELVPIGTLKTAGLQSRLIAIVKSLTAMPLIDCKFPWGLASA